MNFKSIALQLIFTAVLAAALSASARSASASIVYQVSIGSGANSVTGQITTDGNTGALTASDITSYSLQITSGGTAEPFSTSTGGRSSPRAVILQQRLRGYFSISHQSEPALCFYGSRRQIISPTSVSIPRPEVAQEIPHQLA
jgi:hypothetical protein